MIRVVSETVSHGQRYLLNLLERREFFQFTERLGLSFTYLHKVAAGKNKPPCEQIYTMRTYINPGAWFYGEDEELPENAYKPAKKKEWNWRNSLGMKKLLEMTTGDVHAFAVSHNLPYFPVWSMRDSVIRRVSPRY